MFITDVDDTAATLDDEDTVEDIVELLETETLRVEVGETVDETDAEDETDTDVEVFDDERELGEADEYVLVVVGAADEYVLDDGAAAEEEDDGAADIE